LTLDVVDVDLVEGFSHETLQQSSQIFNCKIDQQYKKKKYFCPMMFLENTFWEEFLPQVDQTDQTFLHQ